MAKRRPTGADKSAEISTASKIDLPTMPEQRRASSAYALCYAQTLPVLQRIAREHGYCLAVHGSMSTDLDLIAVPWTIDATEPEPMIEVIRIAIDGFITHNPVEGEKPHGRKAWSIIPAAWVDGSPSDLQWRPWLDISVMPRSGS